MAKYMVLSFAIAGMIVGGWALVYGYSAGIRKRRILADHSGNYDEGRRAVVRGLIYCVVGAVMAIPSAMLWVAFIIELVQSR